MPENIVVSLELAKRLRDAGWSQEKNISSFYYSGEGWLMVCTIHVEGETVLIPVTGAELTFHSPWLSAPTAEEILRELPDYQVMSEEGVVSIIHQVMSEEGVVSIIQLSDIYNKRKTKFSIFKGETLASAAAQMWIYLKTNNLLDATDPTTN